MTDKSDITILIVEDEPVVRNLVRAIVQHEGYSFLAAADGLEALTLSRAYVGEIHLLLTDIGMPKLSGLDLAREIIKDRPAIRILVMSGQDSNEIRKDNLKLPFLKKPFAPLPFLEKLAKVLHGPPAKGLQVE